MDITSEFANEGIRQADRILDELDQLIRRNYNKVNHDYLIEQAESACKHCANNPANCGSGVCHCILEQPVIY